MQSVILPETPKAGKISMSTLATLAKYFDLGDMYYVAISRRDTDVARWLSARGFRVPRTDYDGLLSGLLNAGEQGLPMVRCLVEECGLVMGSYEPRNANYRRDYRRYLDASTAAACSGSVKMMEFVLMQGCAASNDALTYAAERGHLPLLRWLRGRFPYWPWPAGIVAQARTNGMAEVATWLVESGAPGDDDDDDDYGDDDEDDFGDDDDDDFGDDDDDDDE